jgi:hypothetical protein
MDERTSLQVRKPILKALRRFGLKGETYEQILVRLMRHAEREKLMERFYAAESEDLVYPDLDDL